MLTNLLALGSRTLVAVGGNAIKHTEQIGTAEEQLRNISLICKQIVEIIRRIGKDGRVIMTHGNGPQVGSLLIQQERAKSIVPPQPLDVIGGMTQGQMGSMLQLTMINSLKEAGSWLADLPVVTVITHVLVDENDPSFQDPSKPVGPYLSLREVKMMVEKEGYVLNSSLRPSRCKGNSGLVIKKVVPDGRRAYRRVVPSPKPLGLVEGKAIKALADSGVIVIACGGGGIPVTLDGRILRGVNAVIDKDLTGALLAEEVNADLYLILTDIKKVKLDFGRPSERDVDSMTVKEAERYLGQGHFLPGSMHPKVEACINFMKHPRGKAIITSLDKAIDALEGKTGTLLFQK